MRGTHVLRFGIAPSTSTMSADLDRKDLELDAEGQRIEDDEIDPAAERLLMRKLDVSAPSSLFHR